MPFPPGCMWHVTKETKHAADALVWNVSAESWLKRRTSILQEILTFAKVWFGRKMSHFPPEKENLWGGKKREKELLGKNQTTPILYFLKQRNRGTAASVSWGSPQPWAEQPQIPASRCLRWSSRGFGLPAAELIPAGAGRRRARGSVTSSRRGTNPAASDLLPQPNCGFISLLDFGQKFVLLENSSRAFLDPFACYTVTPKFATLKNSSIIYLKGGKKTLSMQTVTWLCQSREPHSSSAETGHGDSTCVCWKGLYWDAGKNNLLRWLAHCSARNGNIWTHNTLKDD